LPVDIPVSSPPRRTDPWDGPKVAMALSACLGATAFVLAAWTLPGPLVLPVFSVLAILAAGVLAVVAWTGPRPRPAARLTYWDIAGALTFIGVCAALLSDPEQALPLMEMRRGEQPVGMN
jgi:hypothetical protein